MIAENLFDLTEEQITMSKNIYNGKIIKCLVAPYHSYRQLEKLLTYTPTTYLFPEKEMSANQLRSFISMIVSNEKISDEVRIVTASQSIILDMITSSVRILTEHDKIVDSPIKTFMANIHDIRYYVLENEQHQKKGEISEFGKKKIGDIFDELMEIKNNNQTISNDYFVNLKKRIEIIGDKIIKIRLSDILSEIPTDKSKNEIEAERLEKMARELRKIS